jgi:hypothetical protein
MVISIDPETYDGIHPEMTTQGMSNKKAKFIYRSLIDKIVQIPTDKFWKGEELLDIEITDWSEYFVIMKRSCRDTYLRNFQFKFLHSIIATNSFLYKIKLKDTFMYLL